MEEKRDGQTTWYIHPDDPVGQACLNDAVLK
jgi:hypothetical protein